MHTDMSETQHREGGAARRREQVAVRVELGRRLMDLSELAGMAVGRVIDMGVACDEPVDVYADGRLLARGRAMTVNGELAVRITELPGRTERAGHQAARAVEAETQ